MRAVSNSDSPLLSELLPGEKLCTSAERRLAASSKLLRVLVLGSKNRVATRRPCNAGNLRAPVRGMERKRWASSSTIAKSSREKAAKSRMWRWLQVVMGRSLHGDSNWRIELANNHPWHDD